MILTCPKCTTQFKLSSEKLGDGGRKVRCTHCGNIWFQEPETDAVENDDLGILGLLDDLENPEVAAELDSDFEEYGENQDEADAQFTDIQDSSSEMEDGDISFAEQLRQIDSENQAAGRTDEQTKSRSFEKVRKSRILSVCAGIILFLLIVTLSIPFKGSLTAHWPALSGLYALIGFETRVEGEGLVFDKIAIIAGEGEVRVEGNIINLTQNASSIPDIHAVLRSAGGEVISDHIFTLEEKTLDGEQLLPFSQTLKLSEGESGNAERATISFLAPDF